MVELLQRHYCLVIITVVSKCVTVSYNATPSMVVCDYCRYRLLQFTGCNPYFTNGFYMHLKLINTIAEVTAVS